jgi:DNA-binding PadR family transcriptional regulator
LYSSFRRLEKEKLITSYWGDESQGGRRKYYRITELGVKKYKINKEEWSFTKKVINKLI